MIYKFEEGQRVIINGSQFGEITSTVPGNGSFAWYFVLRDDGVEDRYVESELELE